MQAIMKKTATEAMRDLTSWWYEGWLRYVDVTADDEEEFIRVVAKEKYGSVHGLCELAKWVDFHNYSMWTDYDYRTEKVRVTIDVA